MNNININMKVGDYGLGRAAFPADYWPLLTRDTVSDPQAAKTIQLTLKELMKTLKKCDATRKISEAGLDIVNAQHKEVEFLRPFRC